jgi:hypothetical protein
MSFSSTSSESMTANNDPSDGRHFAAGTPRDDAAFYQTNTKSNHETTTDMRSLRIAGPISVGLREGVHVWVTASIFV